MPRPTSPVPDSPSSLRIVTATIDHLTNALSHYSRIPSPEPQDVLTCCCGREDCESMKAWSAFRAKLEGRLVLSAGEFACLLCHSPRCFMEVGVRRLVWTTYIHHCMRVTLCAWRSVTTDTRQVNRHPRVPLVSGDLVPFTRADITPRGRTGTS